MPQHIKTCQRPSSGKNLFKEDYLQGTELSELCMNHSKTFSLFSSVLSTKNEHVFSCKRTTAGELKLQREYSEVSRLVFEGSSGKNRIKARHY